MKLKHRVTAVGMSLAVVLGAAACDPGYANIAFGSADGSGNAPVEAGDVIPMDTFGIGQPAFGLDLEGGGFLVLDADTNRIYKIKGGNATLYAGNGDTYDVGPSEGDENFYEHDPEKYYGPRPGDGGPATNAPLWTAYNPYSSQTGMNFDDTGNVTFAEGSNIALRRVTPDGTITTKVVGEPFTQPPMAVLPGSGDEAALLLSGSGVSGDKFGMRLFNLDSDGNRTEVASYGVSHGGVSGPYGFIKTDADRYVVLNNDFSSGTPKYYLTTFDGSQTSVRNLSVVDKPVDLGQGFRFTIVDSDNAGNIYGITSRLNSLGDSTYIVRINTNDEIEFIAGTGQPDTGVAQNYTSGEGLNLTATSVTTSLGGNLIISSGHVLYRLYHAAEAPAISTGVAAE